MFLVTVIADALYIIIDFLNLIILDNVPEADGSRGNCWLNQLKKMENVNLFYT